MTQPLVGLIMGSVSDWETMRNCADLLDKLGIPFEKRVASAHRTPDLLFQYAETAAERGLKCIIAGAGGAAHLPGMVASKTPSPAPGEFRVDPLGNLLITKRPAGVPQAARHAGCAHGRERLHAGGGERRRLV